MKYLVSRLRTVRVVEYFEVEAPDAQVAETAPGVLVDSIVVGDSSVAGPVMSHAEATDKWPTAVARWLSPMSLTERRRLEVTR